MLDIPSTDLNRRFGGARTRAGIYSEHATAEKCPTFGGMCAIRPGVPFRFCLRSLNETFNIRHMSETSVRANQADFLRRLKAKTEPYTVEIEGIKLIIFPSVFPPTTDTRLLARHIHTKPGDRVLDLTCGSGVFSVLAGLQGAAGNANDLNPAAVRNAQENISRYGLDFNVTEGDLYTNIPQETFDYIYSNGPYIEGAVHEPLELAFFGAKKYITGLFEGAKSRLASNGKMLITFAEFGDTAFFESSALENGFEHNVIDSVTSSDSRRTYRLYELSLT